MVLALAEPEPLTVANFTTKSLIPLIYELASFLGGVRPPTAAIDPGLSAAPWGLTPSLPSSSAQIGIVMRQTSL
jgi:hypothetical protein